MIGADEAAVDSAIAEMTKVARDAYDQYNVSSCRAGIPSITCFLKAAQFLALIGSEPPGFQADVAYQVTAARNISRGKDSHCPVEKYIFRLQVDSRTGDGQATHFDTGQMTLTVRDGRITSHDRGPLVIGSGRASCWYKLDEGWVLAGSGTSKGGSFPYRVAGTDDGENLHVRLLQKAKMSVQMSGDATCQAFAELGLLFINGFLSELGTSGLELPAGGKDVDQTETTYGVFEPTGETTIDTFRMLFKMTYPKRA